MTYQRKVEEFESLLTDYSKDGGDVQSQIHTLKVELQATNALTNLEQCKVETFKEQIAMAEDRIKFYKTQRDQKEQLGEQLYNQIRDSISFQEERMKSANEDLVPLKADFIPTLLQEQESANQDIEQCKLYARTTPPHSQTESYQLSGEVATQEKELDR